MEVLTRAIELAPDHAVASNALGVACSMMEAWSQAESHFREASRLASAQMLGSGNIKILERLKAEYAFRRSRWITNLDERGTTLIAQSTDHRMVNLGGDRTIDAFIVRPTEQTATLAGAWSVVRGISADLRAANGLPDSWQPRIHMDVHGAFSTPSAQLGYAAQMAHESGADSVVLLDLSTWFTSPGAIASARAQDIGASFLATMAAATALETHQALTLTGFSLGSVTFTHVGELMDRGALPKEVSDNLRFSNVVLTGYPFHRRTGGDVAISARLLERVGGESSGVRQSRHLE